VIINAAMTLDGKIATVIGDSKMSSMQDLIRVHSLRASVDAIIVGISTVLADNPRLTARFVKVKQKKHPSRIIVDSTARIPLDSRILRSASRIETIVVVTKRADPDKILKIKKSGASVLIAGLRRVDLKETFVFLEKAGYKKILVEGDDAFVTYKCVAKGGKSFRNSEFFGFENDKIKRIDVYFGATYQDGAFVKQPS